MNAGMGILSSGEPLGGVLGGETTMESPVSGAMKTPDDQDINGESRADTPVSASVVKLEGVAAGKMSKE